MRRPPKQKWTMEEEAALQAGVEKHGPGWWRAIQMDPDFRPVLSSRSNIGLKDKWKNLSPQKSKSKAVPALPIPISSPLSSSPPATSPDPPSAIRPATENERNNPKNSSVRWRVRSKAPSKIGDRRSSPMMEKKNAPYFLPI